MTTRNQIKQKFLVLLFTSAVAGTVFALYINHKANIRLSFMLPVTANYQNSIATFAPVTKTNTSSQISPDGTNKLTMTVTTNKNKTKTYVFTVSKTGDSVPQQIFNSTLPDTDTMSLPFNSWSPDNAYVFIQQIISGKNGVLIFNANGQPFPVGDKYLDVKTIFTAKNTNNTYDEATGWASETLLIINTLNSDGSKGPSYWFEVPSKAIIRLSTEF